MLNSPSHSSQLAATLRTIVPESRSSSSMRPRVWPPFLRHSRRKRSSHHRIGRPIELDGRCELCPPPLPRFTESGHNRSLAAPRRRSLPGRVREQRQPSSRIFRRNTVRPCHHPTKRDLAPVAFTCSDFVSDLRMGKRFCNCCVLDSSALYRNESTTFPCACSRTINNIALISGVTHSGSASAPQARQRPYPRNL
jgi:hypothetical protein